MEVNQQKCEINYNRHVKNLDSLEIGANVMLQSKLNVLWSPSSTINKIRAKKVKINNGNILVRNRKFLRYRKKYALENYKI